MVYAVDANKTSHLINAVTRRNTLFTAITRSRAWVRITGWGVGMTPIAEEVQKVKERNYQLEFEVPTAERLAELRHIHRDRSPDEEAMVVRATEGLSAFLEAIERGDADLHDFPVALRERLERLSSRDLTQDDS
jgi:superfamily I DNA and RNA helicase